MPLYNPVATASSTPAEGRVFPSGGTKGYSLPGVDPQSIGTNSPTVNQIRYSPIYVATSITIDQLACEVTTLGASAHARLGLYNADINWQPTSLVGEGGVDASGTGVKTVSLSATLAAGRYLTAFNTDIAATFRMWRGGTRYGQLRSALGANSFHDLWFVSATYGALASTGVAWTGENGASSGGMYYYVVLRITTP